MLKIHTAANISRTFSVYEQLFKFGNRMINTVMQTLIIIGELNIHQPPQSDILTSN